MPSLHDVVSIAEKLSPQERLRLIARLWESLPTESWPALDDSEASAARRQMIESNDRWMDPVPWPIVERLLSRGPRSSGQKIYSAPRRFDLATLFIITIAYSLLLAGMSAMQFYPIASLLIAGFVTLVGVGQAVFFGGARPRTASLLVGTTVYSIGMLAYWLFAGSRLIPPSALLVIGTFVVIGGAILGYLSGTLIGGVFLLAEYLRSFVRSISHHAPAELSEDN